MASANTRREGKYIVLELRKDGSLKIKLTDAGREALPDARKRYEGQAYGDEYALAELMGDEFLGNGWDFTPTLDEWGHMTEAPGLSDDLTIDDDGSLPDEPYRLWFLDDYALYPTLLDRLAAGTLVFTFWHWEGALKQPTRIY